jgi:hypothetical protein
MIVVSKPPMSKIINDSGSTGSIAKWGVELSTFDIN